MPKKRDYNKLKTILDDYIANEREKLLASVFDASIILSPAEQAIIDVHLMMGEDLNYSIIYKLKEINPELYETVRSYNKKTFLVYDRLDYNYDGLVINLGSKLELREMINKTLTNHEHVKRAISELESSGKLLRKDELDFEVKSYIIDNLNKFDPKLYEKIYGYRWRDESYTFPQKVKDLTGFDYQVKLERVSIEELQNKINNVINNPVFREVAIKALEDVCEDLTEYDVDLYILKNIAKFDKVLYHRVCGYANHQGYSVVDFFEELGFSSEGRRKKGRSIEQVFESLIGDDGLKSFRDINNFVDSYRKNKKMKQDVDTLAARFGVPPYIAVSLMCGERLKDVFIETDYIEETKVELKKFLKMHDNSLYGITDYKVYDMLNYIKTYILRGDASQFTTIDVVYFLLGEQAKNVDFGDLRTSNNVSDSDRLLEVTEAFKFVREKEGTVVKAKKLFYDYVEQYRIINTFASKIGATLEEVFDMQGMVYQTLRNKPSEKMKKMKVSRVPHLKEMREDVGVLVESEEFRKLSDDKKVLAYLEYCRCVYNKYANKDVVDQEEFDLESE